MKILIPLDGSKFAEAILEPAVQLAVRSDAEVHLIRVVNLLEARPTWAEAPSSRQIEERMLQAAEEYLDEVAYRYFPDGTVKKVLVGPNPAEEILSYARHEQVNLIAIATHGRTGMARSMMGGVATALLRAYAGPIFMVRPEG